MREIDPGVDATEIKNAPLDLGYKVENVEHQTVT